MDENTRKFAYGAIVFVLVLICAILFKFSGFASANLLNITDLDSFIAFLVSAPLLFLAALLPLFFAVISLLLASKNRAFIYTAALGGAVSAIFISLLIFGFSFEKIILAIFFLCSLVAFIEAGTVRMAEFKSYPTFRTASSSSRTAFLIIGIGLFIASASLGLASNEENAAIFGEKVISLSFNQQSGGAELTGKLADLMIGSQSQALGAITDSPSYKKLETKTDPDVIAFVATMTALKDNIASPATRQKVIAEMSKAQSTQQPITFEFLRNQSPVIGLIADYYWLINAAALTTTFMFFANLLLSNLAGAYAALIRRILEAAQAEKKQPSSA